MARPKDVEGFARRVIRDLDTTERDDLLQICRIEVWRLDRKAEQSGKVYPISYYYKSCWGRCVNYLQSLAAKREADLEYATRCVDLVKERRANLIDRVEYNELVSLAVQYLVEESSSPEQGQKDSLLFQLWLEEGLNCAELAERCPWLADRGSAEATLRRVFVSLRDRFGGDTFAPIVVRRRKRTRNRRGYCHQEYQRQYYLAHRTERIAAAVASRSSRRDQSHPLQSTYDALHNALLSKGYVRYALADSGASAYYVHPDGFRVRVSDHEPSGPSSKGTLDMVTAGRMILVMVGSSSTEEAIDKVEMWRYVMPPIVG